MPLERPTFILILFVCYSFLLICLVIKKKHNTIASTLLTNYKGNKKESFRNKDFFLRNVGLYI